MFQSALWPPGEQGAGSPDNLACGLLPVEALGLRVAAKQDKGLLLSKGSRCPSHGGERGGV